MTDAHPARPLPALDPAGFRLMAECINDLLALFDGEGRFLYANPAWRHTLGYDPAWLVGRARVELIHPDDAPRYRRHADMATTLGGIPLDELQVRHRDGSWRVMESSGRVLRDEHGRPEREVLLWRDITERRRAELLMYDQKRALEAMASGVALEEVLRTIAGIPEARLSGVRAALFLRDRRAGRLRLACTPNLPTELVQALADLPLDGGFESWGTGGLPVPAMPDRPLPREALEVRQAAVANHIASAWSWPIGAPKAEPVGTLVLYATQITPPSRELREVAETAAQLAYTALSARRAEESSRQGSGRLLAHLERWPEPTLVCDGEGRVLWWSQRAQQALGWRNEDVHGRALVELPLLEAESRAPTRQALGALAQGRAERDQWPVRLRVRDGSAAVMEVHAAALPEEGGRPRSVLLMLRDVTAREEAREARQRAQRQTGARPIAAGAARLFGELARAAARSAARLRQEHPAPSPTLDALEAALRQALDRAAQLGQWAGEDAPTGARVNLNEVARDAIARVSPTLPQRVSLDSYLDPDLPPALGSRAELQQVVAQLLANAAEAIGDGRGFVRLNTDLVELGEDEVRGLGADGGALEPGAYALLEVTDTGPGASREVLNQATEPFFSTRGAARGLGLAAAAGVLRAQGGALRLRCQPGHGLTAQVYLPVEPEPPSQRRLALVASTDPSALNDLRQALQAAGLEVIAVPSAQQAIEELRRAPDALAVVVLDAVLPAPGLAGVVERVRERDPRLPILRLGDPDPELELPSVDPEAPDAAVVAAVTRLLGRR